MLRPETPLEEEEPCPGSGSIQTCTYTFSRVSDYSILSCVARLVSLVVILRDWAHRSLIEEEERPDSFLERFRGPEVQAPPSRRSNNQPDANGNTKGNTK